MNFEVAEPSKNLETKLDRVGLKLDLLLDLPNSTYFSTYLVSARFRDFHVFFLSTVVFAMFFLSTVFFFPVDCVFFLSTVAQGSVPGIVLITNCSREHFLTLRMV